MKTEVEIERMFPKIRYVINLWPRGFINCFSEHDLKTNLIYCAKEKLKVAKVDNVEEESE